jgi:small-conductance mechanosensitive channel
MPDPQVVDLFAPPTLLRLLGAGLFGLLIWAALYLLRIAAELLVKKYGYRQTLISDGLPIARLVIVVAAAGFGLFVIFSPPVSAPLAISAALGLALGLGSLDLVKNLIAGIVLRLNQTFGVGDVIDAAGEHGRVTALGMTATSLHSGDDRMVTIPNVALLGSTLRNSSTGNNTAQVTVEFRLPAGSDLDLLSSLAREVAISSPYVYLKRPVSVLIGDEFQQAFLSVRAHVVDNRLEQAMISDITARFKSELRRLEAAVGNMGSDGGQDERPHHPGR